VEPTLAVIGLNHRTASVEVRERFWMNEERRSEALSSLVRSEGIEEVLVFSTCKRTEFVVWGDATLATNSVLRFLTAQYGLTLCEWKSFYRLLDEQALAHAFRVSCGLDSMRIGEGQIARQVNSAWQQARAAGSTGPCLDAILRKALAVRRRVRNETAIADCFVSVPQAAVELANNIFGSLARRQVLLFGAGRIGEAVAQSLVSRGASVCVVSRTDQHAADLARRVGAQACALEARWKRLAAADLAISATAAPEFILPADQMKQVATERQKRNLVLIDLGLPRNVDPAVRDLGGMLLYDLDDLERTQPPQPEAWETESQAEKIILAEVHGFKKELMGEGVTPAIAALRHRLDEICQQELESFRLEQGPFPKEQDQLIAAVSTRITHKIAGSLARRAGSRL
jgi:glutamyl-tRNA reductase